MSGDVGPVRRFLGCQDVRGLSGDVKGLSGDVKRP